MLHDKGFSVVDSLGYATLGALGYPIGSLLSAKLAERVQRRTLLTTAARAREIVRPYAISRAIGAILPFATLPILHAFGAPVLYSVCAGLVGLLALLIGVLGPRTNQRTLEDI